MTMPDPRGPLSFSEYNMGQMLLLSDEFKLFAKESLPQRPAIDAIHFGIIERPDKDLEYFKVSELEAIRPLVCIWPFEINAARIASQAIQFTGSVQLLFEANWEDAKEDDPNLETEADVLRWWKNRVGMILQQSFGGGHDTVFNARRIGQLAWWTRNPIEPDDEHLGFTCVVEWGPDEN